MVDWMRKGAELYRVFRGGMTSGKAVLVLAKTYGLIIDQAGDNEMKRIGVYMGDYYNENEMAIEFLTGYLLGCNPGDPSAKSVVIHYVRQAKLAKERGLIHKLHGDLLDRFFEVAQSRFGVDPAAA